ncbi:CCA tRNA nucleotidyltransferase [Aureibacillus halotolerans]|uniref:CCA-adding enzyme n=1 Tax=Aureibacillus halotolerans TaxID=1508390 RepID=A0A4R6UEI5_9BACI|nr:CCA tRNA nucleotidyltransferase [Aureibacillus halotolerans]TDQ41504.1 tRNA nucleotidyltransferase (CCA-adding enzyme) [Aureibacillus halotolerans]
MKSPLKEGLSVLHALEEHGHQAYFVGGCIRDYVMKRSIHDIDIATSATPDEVIQIFDKTVPTGLQHGTVLVLLKQSSYEVTTFRSEGTYEDFRRPSEVTFIRDLNEDLQRRDFTMNAMAMDRHGLLYDPFGGQEAIERKEILAVGNAEERFMEDPLRMMRALRFSAVLGFSLAAETKEAIQRLARYIAHTSIERVAEEWTKWLACADRDAVDVWLSSGLQAQLPLGEKIGPALPAFGAHCDEWSTTAERWAFLFLLAEMSPSDSVAFLRAWKQSRTRSKDVTEKLQAIDRLKTTGFTPEALYRVGERNATFAWKAMRRTTQTEHITASELAERFNSLPIHHRHELQMTGRDLLAWTGRSPGPWIEDVLAQAEKLVVQQDIVNDNIALKEWFDEHH